MIDWYICFKYLQSCLQLHQSTAKYDNACYYFNAFGLLFIVVAQLFYYISIVIYLSLAMKSMAQSQKYYFEIVLDVNIYVLTTVQLISSLALITALIIIYKFVKRHGLQFN